jgi:hypothetical protein
LHPILKDPNKRNAPSSLDRDPSLAGDPNNPGQGQSSNRLRPVVVAPAAEPTPSGVIVPKIDAGLAASSLALIGTMTGLKGTIFVTNTGTHDITPTLKLVVCDNKGAKIGVTSKIGAPLAPNADEKIVVLATNTFATDLKLLSLTGTGPK